MTGCPHCDHHLTDEEIRSIWAAYCSRKVPPHKKGGGAKPWKKHSTAAGLRCRCEACIRLREIREADFERASGKVRADPDDETLSWDAVVKVGPQDGYEGLIRYEASKIRAREKTKLKQRLSTARYNLKMKRLRERAESEKVWGKIKKEARRRVEEEKLNRAQQD